MNHVEGPQSPCGHYERIGEQGQKVLPVADNSITALNQLFLSAASSSAVYSIFVVLGSLIVTQPLPFWNPI
jgi:hypothetical protein